MCVPADSVLFACTRTHVLAIGETLDTVLNDFNRVPRAIALGPVGKARCPRGYA